MKKFILPIIVFVLFFLVFSSSVYATSEEATPAPKPSNSYNPYCWNTHMIDDIAVCSRASLNCGWACPQGDLKANALCLNACGKTHRDCLKSASAAYGACIDAEKQAQKQPENSNTQVDPQVEKYDRWLECTSKRGLPKSREELAQWEREDSDPNSPCYSESEFSCDKAADGTCIPFTGKFTPRDSSLPPGESVPAEKPSVGVSSSDFKALARANAEYQKAQADLEEIKASKDPRYESKKDFSAEYNSAFKGDEKLKKDLEVIQADLETIHELVSKGKDFSEIEETVESIKNGKIGSYGKLDLFTDAVKSFNDYQDLRPSGVSVKDATTKSTLDNFGTSALTIIPVLKAIDLVATTPDFILGIFGVDKKNWSRKYVTDGFIGKFAPSGVVKQTTDLMIEDEWSDIGNALVYGWGKVQSAQGVWNTAQEAGKLLAGTVGAVPVVIAQGISDLVGGGISVGEKVADFVSSWFTYPN